jgi:hypothetical protein
MELWTVRRKSGQLFWVKKQKKVSLPENALEARYSTSLADTIINEVHRVKNAKTPRFIVFSTAEKNEITRLSALLLFSREGAGAFSVPTDFLRLVTKDISRAIFFPTWIREDLPEITTGEGAILRLAIQIGGWQSNKPEK